MSTHADTRGPEGKIAGSITLTPLFNVDKALETFSRFEIPCQSINHLAITRVVAQSVGHETYDYERLSGKKVLYFPLENAHEVDIDLAVGLLQALFAVNVLDGFYVTAASEFGLREYNRPRD